jgi:hypothetical protein
MKFVFHWYDVVIFVIVTILLLDVVMYPFCYYICKQQPINNKAISNIGDNDRNRERPKNQRKGTKKNCFIPYYKK